MDEIPFVSAKAVCYFLCDWLAPTMASKLIANGQGQPKRVLISLGDSLVLRLGVELAPSLVKASVLFCGYERAHWSFQFANKVFQFRRPDALLCPKSAEAFFSAYVDLAAPNPQVNRYLQAAASPVDAVDAGASWICRCIMRHSK